MTNPAKPSRAEPGYTGFDQEKYLPGPSDAMLRYPVEPRGAGVWVGGGYSGATLQAIKMRESQLAQYIVDWLIEDGWEVYKEVCLGKWSHGAPRADIVARRGNLIWVVETKQSMCLALLDQALRIYRHYPAHYVSVGVWSPKSSNYHHCAAHEFLKYVGIGLFYVSRFRGAVNCSIPPSLRRKISIKRWDELLHDEQKATTAGTKNGYYWTPFKSTVSEIRNFLRRQPGATLDEIIRSISHHYNCCNTAKHAISQHLRDGVIQGIRIDKTRKPYRYYLKQPCKRRQENVNR